ncbi:MAG TPA: Xaa-Pro aminopeptidase [Candidatus Baltobacteraceae bacterium]|jgi:Xaa-Pro aminopeptidase|nr:Xaa-Pro aminopeptidase [Candidatus Baltobacteraceae bacterium]
MQPYVERRERLADRIAGGAAVIPSAKTILRNSDTSYPFRQSSDFYYLTGFDEPDAVLVLSPEHPEHRSVLFLRTRDRDREIWDGARLGVERAVDGLGVDAAYPIADLAERLPEYLVGATMLHYATGRDSSTDAIVHAAVDAARARTHQKGRVPRSFADPGIVLHEMRLIKSDSELAIMRRASAITRLGFTAGMRSTRPGLYEYEVESMIEAEYLRNGAQFVAYESIVGTGDNATTLHYVSNRDRLEAGSLVLVDSGCELDYYATDVTRTWPVDGRFTPEQRAIYELVLAAQEASIAQVRPGVRRNQFHEAAIRTITEGLIDLGLLSGGLDENVEEKHYRQYFMHGTGHWLGLDVHDVGDYRDGEDEPVRLRPGMVTTIEPGIYVRRELDCAERFKGIGVRIEDDILVTTDGNENLTAAIPKTVDELETIVGSEGAALARR